jgi:dihydroflavonol-4-reductase
MPAAPPGASSFAHAAEVAKAHVAAAERGRKGENYILAGTDAPYTEVFSTMEDILGVAHKVKPAPVLLLKVYAEAAQAASFLTRKAPLVTPELVQWLCRKMSYDSRKAQAELGYQTRTLRQMLEDCWNSLN